MSTTPEHRPHSHQAHLEWTPTGILEWGERAGPFTAQLLVRIPSDVDQHSELMSITIPK